MMRSLLEAIVATTAALIAGRRGANAVTPEDFEAAIERVVAGLQKKTQVLSPEEKRVRPRLISSQLRWWQ